MENKKYAKYLFKITENKAVNHDPKVMEVWGHATPPLVFDARYYKDMPLHVEAILIHKAGCGWGRNSPAEGVFGGKKFEDLPMIHDADEVFMLVGTDPNNPDDLGGELELWIGEGKDAEKYTITESTLIFIPKGLVHMPLYFRRVDRPIMMIEILNAPLTSVNYSKVLPPGFKEVWKGK